MSLRLFCLDESAIPRRVVLELRCDGDHGLFYPPQTVWEQHGFIAQYAAAMRTGWLDRGDAVLCPECSGKRANGK